MSFCTKGIENTGEFYCNVSSTHNGNLLRLILQFKKPVTCNAQIGTWNILWNGWITTSRDRNMFPSNYLFASVVQSYLHLVLAEKRGTTKHILYFFISKIRFIYSVKSLDISVSFNLE